MNNIDKLLLKLSNLNEDENNIEREWVSSTQKIYNEIIKFDYFLNEKNMINLLYLFNQSEELLENVKKTNIYLSKYYFERLENIYNNLSENELKEYFSTLYYPAIAYYAYIFGDEIKAVFKFERCIYFINNNSNLNKSLTFQLVSCEQTLNRFKCFFKMKNIENALNESDILLNKINIELNQHNSYDEIFCYYLDKLFSKIEFDDENVIKFISLNQRNFELYFLSTKKNVNKTILSNIPTSFNIDITLENFDEIMTCPSIIKKIIFKFFCYYYYSNREDRKGFRMKLSY